MSNRPRHSLPAGELGGGGARLRVAGTMAHPWTAKTLETFDRFCLRFVIRALRGVPLRIAFGDQLEAVASSAPPIATVRVFDRLALMRLILNPELGFGEGYTDGRIEVEGDLVGLLEDATRRQMAAWPTAGFVNSLRRWGSSNPVTRARDNVHCHYDLGNEFYQLWLDQEMVYTCGYYAKPDLTLEEAQTAKHEHIARKLNLQPGETVFEAGCGWGSLSLYLARYCGVRVRAWNVSHEQVVWARARAVREGLANQVEFIEEDYRRMTGSCDAFLSVGMLEHVGRRQYPALGEVIHRCLHPTQGRGLLHFIGRNLPAADSPWISKYIFPGAYIPSLREALSGVLEPKGFSVLDVENLRRHYAATLADWLARFENCADRVQALFDERFVRMWRLYLAEAQAGFRAGNLQLFQVTFARPVKNDGPMTRATLYRE